MCKYKDAKGDKMIIQNIIDQFWILSKKENWTQEDAAREIGCSRSHLSKVFSGKTTPSIKLLEKMEEVLDEYGE